MAGYPDSSGSGSAGTSCQRAAVRSLRPQFDNWRLLRVNEDEPKASRALIGYSAKYSRPTVPPTLAFGGTGIHSAQGERDRAIVVICFCR
jgi:hypothetical protein